MADNTDRNEKQGMDFESAYRKLSQCAGELNDPEVSLNDAIAKYREGLEYYRICSDILKEADQLIQMYDKQKDEIREIEDV